MPTSFPPTPEADTITIKQYLATELNMNDSQSQTVCAHVEPYLQDLPANTLKRQKAIQRICQIFCSHVWPLSDHHHQHHEAAVAAMKQTIKKTYYRVRSRPDWRDRALEYDDFYQEASSEILGSLHTYRYKSEFAKWADTVATHTILRMLGWNQPQKSQGLVQSLDQPIPTASANPLAEPFASLDLADQHTPSLEESVLYDILVEEITRLLATHPDQRLLLVFEQRLDQDVTQARIADILGMTQSAISKLISKIKDLVRNDPWLKDWFSPD